MVFVLVDPPFLHILTLSRLSLCQPEVHLACSTTTNGSYNKRVDSALSVNGLIALGQHFSEPRRPHITTTTQDALG